MRRIHGGSDKGEPLEARRVGRRQKGARGLGEHCGVLRLSLSWLLTHYLMQGSEGWRVARPVTPWSLERKL